MTTDELTQPLWNVYGDLYATEVLANGRTTGIPATTELVGRARADSRAEAVEALRQRAIARGFDEATLFAGWQCDCGGH